MMLIQVEKDRFDRAFQVCLEKLKLEQFSDGGQITANPDRVRWTADMHRKFHYEICRLKDELIKG